MKRIQLLIALSIFSFCVKAQDTLKTFNHEIGINVVSLVKQLVSSNPSSTLNQLPYDIFYNLYYQDRIGLRVGLGLLNQKTETSIDGQPTPRTAKANTLNLRIGASYNFVKTKRLTLNVFGDFLTEKITQQSINTQTTQAFGNPQMTTTTTSDDDVNGTGFQAGVGVKFNIYKHLSLYTEIPISYMSEKNTTKDVIESTGTPTRTATSSFKVSTTRITLPVTVYLVLRF